MDYNENSNKIILIFSLSKCKTNEKYEDSLLKKMIGRMVK